MAGLLTFKSNDDIEREEAEKRENLAERSPEPVVSRITAQIQQAWSRNKRARMRIDTELLACMRQRKGEYDPDELRLIEQSGGGNTIYMMLTATKCAAAAAWISDVMLPADDLPIGVESTPLPDLPPAVYAELVQRVVAQAEQAMAQSGQQPTPAQINDAIDAIEADVKKRVSDQAKDRAENMTTKLRDTLEEGGLRKALEDYIEDFVTFPAAILKGPVHRSQPKIEWDANWQPRVARDLRVEVERVSPFDVYPSSDAETCDDGEFIERLRMTRKQLRSMMGRDGYDDDAIERVLRDESDGRLNQWLWTDAERADLENKAAWWISPTNTIDALHYWGAASGMTLMEWGITGDDIEPLDEYDIEAILIGNECIRCVINDDPLGRRPYQVASFRRVPGAFWGVSIPYLVRNTQKMCNSVARALADNLSISSGPQVMVNNDALADGESITNLYPWKIWQMSFDMTGSGAARPLDFYQPSSNANELLIVFKEFEQRADDESSIPRYTYGNEKVGGAGSTASGLSMLFDATAKGIRKAIGHIDAGVMRPLVEKAWMDEMRYGEDVSIKGDHNVVARGAAALLIKDQAQHRRQEFLDRTNNPVDMQIIGMAGRAEVLRANAISLDMDPDKIVPKREEIAQRMRQQAEQKDPKTEIDQAKAQTDRARLELDAHKAEAEAEEKAAELAEKAAENQRRFRLDTARYLSGEEEKQFKRQMGLVVSQNQV